MEKNPKKVKHVNFKLTLKGNGIVNFDSGDQKFLWNRESKKGNKNVFSSSDNNNMFSKKHYFTDENGNLSYTIKISSDALRNAIFKGDAIATSPSIQHHKSLLNSFIGSPLGLIRGYMFASSNETYKRKSPLTITSAKQTNNSVSYMEFHSKSGDRNDTSIFNKETIGEITYSSEGCVNLQSLELLSCDTIFDRISFNADDFEILKIFLTNNLPNFTPELGYHKLKTSSIDVAEYGVKLNGETILYLIKETFKRILNLSIERSTAYAKTDSLEIELVYDAVDISKNKTIKIKSMEDIDNLNFEVEEFYVLSDEIQSKEQRKTIEDTLKNLAKKKKEENDEKEVEKGLKKGKKDNNITEA
jgi:hypothetical protein